MKASSQAKRFPALLLSVLPAVVKAGIELIILITVLIIGAVLVYLIYQVIKAAHLDRRSPGTNQVSADSVINVGIESPDLKPIVHYQAWLASPYGIHTNYYNPGAAAMDEGSDAMEPGGFMIQYGLDRANRPWVAPPGGGPLSGNSVLTVQTVTDTSSNFGVSITAFGVTTTYLATTNGADQGNIKISQTFYPTNGSVGVTNSFGDTLQATVNGSNRVVILERSPDLASWTPVLTNSIATGSMQNYTDTNATNASLFYRLVEPDGI
ncbi:MAG TPA: hypothetical protein VFV81_01345 [Verrucomicrobiae bacterium]|nr:hypothetical protein [Verrucomicrobiae bacterium]